MKTLLLLLFPILLSAQIDFVQTQYGLFATGNNPSVENFMLCEVEDSQEFIDFLNKRLILYTPGAVVYEPQYNITIRVFPLYRDKVLILYKGEQDSTCYNNYFTYYKPEKP